MKYETNITVQKQEISDLRKKNESFQTDNVQLQKTKESVNLLIKNFIIEKSVYEEKFTRYQKENADLEKRASEVQKNQKFIKKLMMKKKKKIKD